MPQVSTICANYTVPAETSQAIYFHELCKKYLTSSAYYCIIGAARLALLKTNAQLPQKVLDNPGSCAYTTRVGTGSNPAETTSFEKNFTQSCKKDLTLVAFALILARGTPKKSRRRTTTGAPAPKFSRGQAPARPGRVPRGTLCEALA